jgi:hypothetical protein
MNPISLNVSENRSDIYSISFDLFPKPLTETIGGITLMTPRHCVQLSMKKLWW